MDSSVDSPLDIYSWFVSSPVRDGLGLWELGPGLFILAVLLGYAIFTDLRGRIIPNQMTLPLILASLALAPLLYEDPKRLLLFAVPAGLFFVAMIYTERFGAGDTKLLIALAFLFHKSIIGIFFLANFIAFLYAVPVMLLAYRAKRRGEFDGRIRKIALQFGPAIAVATAVPVAVSGAGWWALAYLLVMTASAALFSAFSKGPLPEALEEVEEALEPLEGEESTELFEDESRWEDEGGPVRPDDG